MKLKLNKKMIKSLSKDMKAVPDEVTNLINGAGLAADRIYTNGDHYLCNPNTSGCKDFTNIERYTNCA